MKKIKYKLKLEKGDKFGRWEVICPDVQYNTNLKKCNTRCTPAFWKYICKCSCDSDNDTTYSIFRKHLVRGDSTSCGCHQAECTSRAKSKINIITNTSTYICIHFFNSDNYTIIDKEDYDLVKEYCWLLSDQGYAYAGLKGGNKKIKLHRLIMGLPIDLEIDHIDGNRLNNLKNNLRICSHQENSRNQKKRVGTSNTHVGVHRLSSGLWKSIITVDNVTAVVGIFKNKEDAILARQNAEIKLFGDFAPCVSRRCIID